MKTLEQRVQETFGALFGQMQWQLIVLAHERDELKAKLAEKDQERAAASPEGQTS